MSMETERFEALRKLLALKKHEQPPPGYFDQFSSEVMARLHSGEHTKSDWWSELGDQASWLQRILGLFEAKPALAGAFGMLICGMVVTGVYFSQKAEESATGVSPAMAANLKLPGMQDGLALSQPTQALNSSSTNPVMNASPSTLSGGSLFDQIGVNGQAAPVSLHFGGN